jgi:nucleoside-diphosphate-sugar epimerase
MNNRNVAVTGASGVIGKVVVKLLINSGYSVRVLMREGSVNHWPGEKLIEIFSGDISDKILLARFLKDTWGVIHLAAEMDSSQEWDVFKRVNVDSVENIMKLVPVKSRLVVASSVVVYADTGFAIRDEKWKLKKDGGVDKYVQSKLEALHIIRNSKRKIITVMPSTVVDHEIFGREQFITDNWLWKWVWNNIGGGIPGGLMAAVGDSQRIMNFVEVKDVAQGIVLALEKGKLGEEYILAGENISAKNYLIKMSKRCGKKYLKIRIPNFFLRMFGLGGVVNMNYSYEKAKSQLGYLPKWKL